MKIMNEYLIIDPINGKVEKYVEIEGENFFKCVIENNNLEFYWVSKSIFYERYDITKKLFCEWKETRN